MRAEDPNISAATLAAKLGLSRERVRQILVDLGLPTKAGKRRDPIPLIHRPEYKCWWNLIDRCHNPQNRMFRWYGARGITVCERWRSSFKTFIADMGPRPSPKHSIDRIDNDGNYEPGNCRWATKRQQVENMRHPCAWKLTDEAEARSIWFDKSIPSNALAAKACGVTVRTMYRHFGVSGRPAGWPTADRAADKRKSKPSN